MDIKLNLDKRNSKPKRGDPKAFSNLEPLEWDFSTWLNWDLKEWREWEVESALQYEYARSSERIRFVVESIHRHVVDGKTVQQHLIDGTSKSAVEEVVRGAEISSKNGNRGLSFTLFGFIIGMKRFPLPWTLYRRESPDDLADWRVISVPVPADMFILPIEEKEFAEFFDMLRDSRGFSCALFALRKNSPKSKQKLVNQFSDWIDKIRGDNALKRGLGGVKLPWHKVKALAAYRLSTSGLSFDRAKCFLDIEKRRVGRTFDTWPLFENPGKWSKAKTDVMKAIEALEENFYLPCD